MLRLLTDENFNQRILRGLRRRIDRLDCILVQDSGIGGVPDELLFHPTRLHFWEGGRQRVLPSVINISAVVFSLIEAERQEGTPKASQTFSNCAIEGLP